MPTVADCLRQHAPEYLRHFGDSVPIGHRRFLSLIQRCRTGELGAFAYHCEGCGCRHHLGRSCGNRHCPNCQHDKTQKWLQKQTQRLIPVGYFLTTFTVPRQVAMVLRAHQKEGYLALFDTSSQAMIDVAGATKSLKNAKLGFFGVLHTWGRDPLVYHPHSNKRIEYCDAERVVYRYTPSGTHQSKTRSVSGNEFVAGFLQHVLPPGFQKIRYYGWMSPNSRISLDLVRWLVWLYRGWTYWLASGHAPRTEPTKEPTVECPRCGGAMKLAKVIYKDCSLLVQLSTHQRQRYDDSG